MSLPKFTSGNVGRLTHQHVNTTHEVVDWLLRNRRDIEALLAAKGKTDAERPRGQLFNAVIREESPTVVTADQQWRYPFDETQDEIDGDDLTIDVKPNGISSGDDPDKFAWSALETRTVAQYEDDCEDSDLARVPIPPGTPVIMRQSRDKDGNEFHEIIGLRGATIVCCDDEE